MSPTSTPSLKGAATARAGRLMYFRAGAAFAPKVPDPTARPARNTPIVTITRLIVSSLYPPTRKLDNLDEGGGQA